MSSEPLAVETRDHVATVTLHRPDSLNAINPAMADALAETMLATGRDDDVRAVVLTGKGRAFCAGGDLREFHEGDPERPGDVIHGVAGAFHEAIFAMRTMPKAVIAAINGPAAGGGFSMAMACDLRVISADAFLQVAYNSNGLSIDGGGTFTLPRIVGLARAFELTLLDERIQAERALEMGLVNLVAKPDALEKTAHEWASNVAKMPRGAIGRTKQLFNRSFENPLEKQLEDERICLVEAANSPEGKEGITAFLEKRRPDFIGLD